MKKLNRKGFTLVELLAVIIILAIVVGISIPAITNIINGSKNSALGVTVESALDHMKDQYDIYNIDATSADSVIKNLLSDTDKTIELTTADDLEELGFDINKVSIVELKAIENAADRTIKFCVTVKQIPSDSEYFTTDYWTANGNVATPKTDVSGNKYRAGNGCQ